jgi:hypothetical protein
MTFGNILFVRGSPVQISSHAGSRIASSTVCGTSSRVISLISGRSQQPHPSFGPSGSTFGVQSTNANDLLNISGYAAECKGTLSGGAAIRGGIGVVGVRREGHMIGTLGDNGRGEWDEDATDACLRGKRVKGWECSSAARSSFCCSHVDMGMRASGLRLIVKPIIADDRRLRSAGIPYRIDHNPIGDWLSLSF